MPTEDSVVVPPLFIWDPQSSASSHGGDDLDDDDDIDGWESNVRRVGTDMTTSEQVKSSRGGGRHSADDDNRKQQQFVKTCHHTWSDVSLRTQLWDAFRLARVVLGEPIKSHRLTNHSILRAIQRVAEMRLNIIELQETVDTLRQQRELLLYQQADTGGLPISPSEEEVHRLLEGHPNDQEPANASSIPLQYDEEAMDAVRSKLDAALEELHQLRSQQQQPQQHQQQQQHLDQEIDASSTVTPLLSMSSSSSLVSGDGDIDSDHMNVVGAMPTTYPSSAVPSKEGDMLFALGSIATSTAAATTVARVDRAASDSQHSQQQLQRDEQRQQLQRQLREQHEEISRLLSYLNERVDETSTVTAAKIQAVHVKLADAQIRQAALHQQQLQDLRDELEAKQNWHTDQIQSLEAQHQQTVADLQHQARSYQDQLQQQNLNSLQGNEWNTSSVTSVDAEKVLQSVLALSKKQKQRRSTSPPDGQITSKISANTKDNDDEEEDDCEADVVHQQVINLLSRLTQCRTVQEGEMDDVKERCEALRLKRAETEDGYDFLQLQKELLLDDLQKTKPEEEWTELLTLQQAQYQQELNELLLQEERRLEEMEALEKELDHLAFVAVECEDLEQEYQQRQQAHKDELQKLHVQSEATMKRIQTLREEVDGSVQEAAQQANESGGDQHSVSAEELRIRLLERALARRDDELLQTKAQLKLSQDRIHEFEQINSTKRRTYAGSGGGGSTCTSTTPVDYDTDSTAATVSSRAARMGTKKV